MCHYARIFNMLSFNVFFKQITYLFLSQDLDNLCIETLKLYYVTML